MIRFVCRTYVPYRWMRRTKLFYPSLDRLAELSDAGTSDGNRLAAASDEFIRILQSLRLSGIWRWTGRHRLAQMDGLLSAHAAAEQWTAIRMLDIGASDGTTTLDTAHHLRKTNGIPVSLMMLDRHTRLFRLRRHGVVLYFTSDNRPVLARFGRFALVLEPMEGVEGIVFNRLAAVLSRRYARILGRADLTQARSISMISPAVAQCPDIEAFEHDLFDRNPQWAGQFDVVRASNVLNLSYYPEARIEDALSILHGYLKDGGVLVVSRNEIGERGETERGGIWRRTANGFARRAALDALPEIASLIDGLDIHSSGSTP